jgi:hypothetical protein
MVGGIRSTCLHRRGCGGRIREVGHGGWSSEPPIINPSHFVGSSPRSCEYIIRASGCAVRTQRYSRMKDWRHANRLRGSRKGCDVGGHSIALQGFGGSFWCDADASVPKALHPKQLNVQILFQPSHTEHRILQHDFQEHQ